ncbi:hypothetical protein CAPTEDRAFT_222478 [Capitella teleta]|uniref:Uncharacterized protein n=1 Tax=Capitella teleta TaxID=283909 RepID=R7UEB6_CAPTE|nr:hypothetical protein CAPTEDRAFT_222478 [Capitella teleta]|eukprot:ELU02133.1 hypothetical protein CAPTEDRAFT_222478 [Capitella teleta]
MAEPPTYQQATNVPPQGYQPGYPSQQPPYPAQGYPSQGGYPAQPSPNTPLVIPGAAAYPSQPPQQPQQPYLDPQGNPTQNAAETGSAWQDDSGFTGNSFSDKAIRRAFIRKVYLILMTQLLVTCAFIAFFLFYHPANRWVKMNSWFYYLSYATFIVTYITLVCCPSVRRKSPGNYICLAVFTLAFSYMTATISSYYDSEIVLIAIGITAAVCLSITLFAIQTKVDFTLCSGLLFAGSMVLFFFGFACIIVYATIGPNYILRCVYGALAALLFSLFLAYDTQMLIGGRKHELSPEDYIFGALQLYLDIVYIFLIILSFFGGKD